MSMTAAIDVPEQAAAEPVRLRLTGSLIFRIAMSAGPLAVAFWLTSDKLDWRRLLDLDVLSIGLCTLLSLLVVWLLAWRWQKVTRVVVGNRPVPALPSFGAAIWVGLAANQVLPSIVVGDALRVGLLSRHGLPLGNAVGSVFLDRVYGMVGLALLAGTGGLFFAPLLSTPALAVGALVLGGAVAMVVGWRLFAPRLRAIFTGEVVSTRASLVLIGVAIMGHLANVAIFLIVAHGLGIALPVLPVMGVMFAVQLAGALPISVAGWGVRELALVQASGLLGLPAENIVLASVTYGLILFVLQVPGFLLLARRVRP
jgi:glycosyltransferase 2 family protein